MTTEQQRKRKKILFIVLCGALLVGCLGSLVLGNLALDNLAPDKPVVIYTTVMTVTVTSAAPLIVTTAANATNEAEIHAIQTLTAMPTATATSTPTPRPTKTPQPTKPPTTSTVAPTLPPAPTSTVPPVVPPTKTPQPTAVPTELSAPTEAPPPAAICDCSGNVYNCSDFGTHAQAQACHDYCISLGCGDIHKLDRDNDGLACESLP